MSLDRVIHTRTIYSVWDFFGDVGGLFDMLKLLAQPIVAFTTLLFSSGLDHYLIQALFKRETRFKFNESVLSHIERRKAAKVKWCNWLFYRQNHKL